MTWRSRRQRRYRSLAKKHLPGWAIDDFLPCVENELSLLNAARVRVRRLEAKTDASHVIRASVKAAIELEKRSRIRLERIARLCTYSEEMEAVWTTIKATPIAEPGFLRDDVRGNRVIPTIVSFLDDIVEKFDAHPKRTNAQRKKSLLAIGKTIDGLLKQLQDDPEAAREAGRAFDAYLFICGLELPMLRSMDPDAREVLIFDTDEAFYRQLRLVRDSIVQLADRASPVATAHPGRADSGFTPYLIRELSGVMKKLFDKPLDRTVAILASTVLNLPEPLGRDDVRPYTKTNGKIMEQDQ